MKRIIVPKFAELTITDLLDNGSGSAVCEEKSWEVWNALPGETVNAQLFKKRKGVRYGVAQDIITASPDRVASIEEHFLSCSPWQIFSHERELATKLDIARKLFSDLPSALLASLSVEQGSQWCGYRNKMEFSFYSDDDERLSLALFKRGSKGKVPLDSCALASPAINTTASLLLTALSPKQLTSRQLKTAIIRSTQDGQSYVALFVKDAALTGEQFSDLPFENYSVYYSDHRSPASVTTALLFQKGSDLLEDVVLGKKISYHGLGFFQVNIPTFEKALLDMKPFVADEEILDFYCGAGTIGIALSDSITRATLVEQDRFGANAAARNIITNHLTSKLDSIGASAESIVEKITAEKVLIVDPPRAGLHHKVVERINEVQPKAMIYLSCNPVSQARDIALLVEHYTPVFFKLYNFFPRTPHLESLIILKKKV